MKNLWPTLKQDQAGAGDGGTGTGNGNLLTGTDGGSGTPPGQAPPGGGTGSGSAPPDPGGTGSNSSGGQAPSWKSQLPPELQEDQTIGRFNSVTDLAAGYRNLQRQFSAGKLAIPTDKSTPEEWTEAFQKLGLPKDVKDYAIKFKEGVTIDEKFSNEFKENAFKLGILPKQAQALADWFGEKNLGAESQYKEMLQKNFNEEVTKLKTEWGDAFQRKVGNANVMFRQLPEDMQKSFSEAGLAKNTSVVRAMAFLADKFMGEKQLADVDAATGGGKLTPAEAQKQINEIMGDTSHPYHKGDHPGHKQAVADVQKLFATIHK